METDTRSLLPAIQVPTLVMVDDEGTGYIAPEIGRYIAGRIPSARLVSFRSQNQQYWYAPANGDSGGDPRFHAWVGRATIQCTTACWRPCFSPTSSTPPPRPPWPGIRRGGGCGNSTTRSSGPASAAIAAVRSRPWGMGSSRCSTPRPRCQMRAGDHRQCQQPRNRGSRRAAHRRDRHGRPGRVGDRGCDRRSRQRVWPAPARCWCLRRSRISPRDQGSRSRTAACTS